MNALKKGFLYVSSKNYIRTSFISCLASLKDVIILDEFGQRLQHTAGPYNEGAHLTLICEAENGKIYFIQFIL